MDMAKDWLFNPRSRGEWSNLQQRVQSPGSSSRSEPEIVLPKSFTQLNDHVYEVCRPSTGERPSVEIVFFHGLQLEDTDEPHIRTWLSKGRTSLWSWLAEDHHNARILTVSYDASLKRTHTQGRADMFTTCENLITCLTDSRAAVGNDGCPVILVGHCLGGLVLKEVLVKAHLMLGENTHQNLEPIKNFLTTVKAIFSYATPHHGFQLTTTSRVLQKGPLFENMVPLNDITQRGNVTFSRIRQAYKWITRGVGANQVAKLENFPDLIVTEASARCDVDQYYTIDANHFDVCRPESKIYQSYQFLSSLVGDILWKDNKAVHLRTGLHYQTVGLKVPLDNIEKMLFCGPRVVQRLGIVGISGIGKTTLVESLFDQISSRFEYACFGREIKRLMGNSNTTDHLHKVIMEKLTRKGHLVDPDFLWSTLKGKQVLIILDDVESKFHTRVMTEKDSFSGDSLVIVTSQNKQLLESQHFTIYEMETLGHEASKELLCLHAFKGALIPSYFGEHVTKVADLCGGLPLALEVAGGYLYNQTNAIWDDVCTMLVEAKPSRGSNLEEDRLWSILKMSYHGLSQEEQHMFLDVATYLEGESAVDVRNNVMCNFHSWENINAEWQNLLDKSLVKHERSSGDEANWTSMHELLQILGREMNQVTKEREEIRGRLSLFGPGLANRQRGSAINLDSKIISLGLYDCQGHHDRQSWTFSGGVSGSRDMLKVDVLASFLADIKKKPEDWNKLRVEVVADEELRKHHIEFSHPDLPYESSRVELNRSSLALDAIFLACFLIHRMLKFSCQMAERSSISVYARFLCGKLQLTFKLLDLEHQQTMSEVFEKIFKLENQIPLQMIRNVILIVCKPEVTILNQASSEAVNGILRAVCWDFVANSKNSLPSCHFPFTHCHDEVIVQVENGGIESGIQMEEQGEGLSNFVCSTQEPGPRFSNDANLAKEPGAGFSNDADSAQEPRAGFSNDADSAQEPRAGFSSEEQMRESEFENDLVAEPLIMRSNDELENNLVAEPLIRRSNDELENNLVVEPLIRRSNELEPDLVKCKHLLHCLVEAFWRGAQARNATNLQIQELSEHDPFRPELPAAHELNESGIEIRRQNDFFPTFERPLLSWKATLFLPTIRKIDRFTEQRWKSLLAFEDKYGHHGSQVYSLTSYLCFMHNLIKTEADIQLLKKGNTPVFCTTLGNNDILQIFVNLRENDCHMHSHSGGWSFLRENIAEFHNSGFRRKVHDHFEYNGLCCGIIGPILSVSFLTFWTVLFIFGVVSAIKLVLSPDNPFNPFYHSSDRK